MSFEVKDRAAAGRLGRLQTPHGTVTTPALLPVVNPNLPTVPPADMKRLFGAEMVITNSYILRKSEALRERALTEGVHKTIGWDGPVMTDSGTFQSYVYGSVDVQPLEIVEFQKRIGVDVGTILDVFTTPDHSREQAATDLEETLRRAAASVQAKNGMLLAATVQGGVYPDLRAEAARRIGALDVDLVPIGGVVPLMESARYADLARVILAAKQNLPAGKPVHLFGAGHPVVWPLAVALGCDLFDSASYAKYAKDGRLILPHGTRNLNELEELPCVCPECERWRSAQELRRLEAPEREAALARHNLHVSFAEIRRIREAIREGSLWELVEERASTNPALLDALRVLRSPDHTIWLEGREPTSMPRAFSYRSAHSLHRPIVHRLHQRILTRWQPTGPALVVLPPRTKPYADAYAAYLDAFVASGLSFVVDTPFGPVPLELERLFPVAQSVFPQVLDEEARHLRDAYAHRFYRQFGGCDVLPFEPRDFPARPDGPSPDALEAFDQRRLRAVANYQFGGGAADLLLGPRPSFRRSPNTNAVRNVDVDGEHVASLRPTDGLLSLRWAGAQRLQRLPSPLNRIRLDEEPAAFVAQGKNVMARFVLEADPALRPGDEVVVVDPHDRLCGVGRCFLSGLEMRDFARGLAAKTTEHAPSAP